MKAWIAIDRFIFLVYIVFMGVNETDPPVLEGGPEQPSDFNILKTALEKLAAQLQPKSSDDDSAIGNEMISAMRSFAKSRAFNDYQYTLMIEALIGILNNIATLLWVFRVSCG